MKTAFLSFGSGMRHRMVQAAMESATKQMGWQIVPRADDAEIGIAWGMTQKHQMQMQRFKDTGRKMLLLDLPYWNRAGWRDYDLSFYKITINSMHPNEYLDAAYGGAGRYDETNGPMIKNWNRQGAFILFAGMGPKGCEMYNKAHGEWDRQAIAQIKQATDMPIIYKPKPSDKAPMHIDGVRNLQTHQPIANLLRNAHAVVTHHGNSSLDGLWRGVPCFCADGAGLLMGKSNLAEIDSPLYPENRREFFEKLAWFNWSFDDIVDGKPLKHLLDKGIL